MWLSSLCGQGYVGMIPGMATTKTHTTSQKACKKKPSSVRHTRAIQRERSKRPTMAPSAPEIEARLTELIHPAPYAQVAAVHAMRLRQRILNLPVMLAFVLSLIWRHLGSVTEAVRVLREEGLLWTQPTTVSAQAVTDRLGSLPTPLFAGVFHEVVPQLQQRGQRRVRPQPPRWPGRITTLPPWSRWMDRPWTPCCARRAYCASTPTPPWLAAWRCCWTW